MAKRSTTEEPKETGNAVVARALTFFKERAKAETTQRQNELEDLTFEAGDHWDAKVKADRVAQGKPVMEIDLLSGPLNQIEGQSQESRAGITLSANKPGTTTEAAGLLQGFARNIEQQSGAIDIYQHAVRRCSRAGRAGWRLKPEYETDSPDETTPDAPFRQTLRLKWVDNWHCVYLGDAKEQDGSDRTQALIVEDLTHAQYTDRFGESDRDSLAASLGAKMQSVGDTPADWLTSERIRVAEYMEVKMKERTLLLIEMNNPMTGAKQRKSVYADQLPKGPQERKAGKFKAGAPVLPQGWTEINRRPVTEKTCCWYFINAKDVLEEAVWPIPYIPVIEIEGERRNIDGTIDRRGVVRMGKQLNRMADFHETAIIEQIDLARTAPWLYEWSQIEDFEDIWKNPRMQVGLPYRRVSGENGAAIPPPQRIMDEPAIQASVIAAQRSEQLLLKVTGSPDIFANETQASQGNQSGKAILARQRQQEVGNSKYLVSRNRGIAYTGKLLLAWAPGIYDTPRVHRGVKSVDEKDQAIVTYCGEQQKDFAMQLAQRERIPPENVIDLKHAAKYDVAVNVGKPYATQRMETVDIITSAIQAFPPIAPKALPILFRNADGPGMQELAAALEPKKNAQQGVPIEEAQKAQQVINVLTETINTLKQEAESRKMELDSAERIKVAELTSKEKIVAAQEETKRLIAKAEADLGRLQQLAEQAHEVGLENMRAVHDDDAAELAHAQNLEQLAAQPEPETEAGI